MAPSALIWCAVAIPLLVDSFIASAAAPTTTTTTPPAVISTSAASKNSMGSTVPATSLVGGAAAGEATTTRPPPSANPIPEVDEVDRWSPQEQYEAFLRDVYHELEEQEWVASVERLLKPRKVSFECPEGTRGLCNTIIDGVPTAQGRPVAPPSEAGSSGAASLSTNGGVGDLDLSAIEDP